LLHLPWLILGVYLLGLYVQNVTLLSVILPNVIAPLLKLPSHFFSITIFDEKILYLDKTYVSPAVNQGPEPQNLFTAAAIIATY
jgi:hypothetical protein